MLMAATLILSFGLCVFFYYPTKRLAFAYGIIDKPAKRKIHNTPKPRLGGLAMFLAFVCASSAVCLVFPSQTYVFGLSPLKVLLFGSFAFLIGFTDDLLTIGSKRKLTAQAVLALWVYHSGFKLTHLYFGPGLTLELGSLAPFVTILWIVGIMNAVNLIDGMDGLAAGVSSVAFAMITLFALFLDHAPVLYFSLAMLGACLGFLVFNFNPAKIFMGDCGSLFLGFMLSVLSVSLDPIQPQAIPFYVPLLILMFPILDTFVAVIRRTLRTFQHQSALSLPFSPRLILSAIKRVLEADGDHIHHRLLKKNLTQRQVAFMLYLFSICCGLIAFLMLHLPTPFSWILGLTVVFSIYHMVLSLDYVEFNPRHLRKERHSMEEENLLNPRSRVVKKSA